MKHQSLRCDRWTVTLILCIGMVLHAGAQSFTQRIQKKVEGQGTVTIHHSAEIDRLVNANNVPTTPPQTDKTNSGNATATTPKATTTVPQENPTVPKATPVAPKTNAAETLGGDTPKREVRNTRKVAGYRVQAFAGGNSRRDRQMAERTRSDIRALFPQVAVYVHFYSPRWICRVGNYRTYEEAHQMMVELHKLGYKQASIVKGTIIVQY